jgi:hypothetical protein
MTAEDGECIAALNSDGEGINEFFSELTSRGLGDMHRRMIEI